MCIRVNVHCNLRKIIKVTVKILHSKEIYELFLDRRNCSTYN